MNGHSKTPALGSPYRRQPITLESLQAELAEHKADTALGFAQMSGKLDTVNGKLDVVLDLFAEAQRGKNQAIVEEHKTERVRMSSRSKIFIALLAAVGGIAGALTTALASGCA